jgi:hypothetical protein
VTKCLDVDRPTWADCYCGHNDHADERLQPAGDLLVCRDAINNSGQSSQISVVALTENSTGATQHAVALTITIAN